LALVVIAASLFWGAGYLQRRYMANCKKYSIAMQLNKILALPCLLLLFIPTTNDYGQELHNVGEVINTCNLDTLKKFVSILSGEIPFTLGNQKYIIQSRNTFQPGNELTAKFISSQLRSYGLDVKEQEFFSREKNIYAVQDGMNNSETILICAHYDCCGCYTCNIDSSYYAPGADDNGSGVAATLECARILSKCKTKYRIIYAFWDAEEQGLIGSRYYATLAANNKEKILGVLNLDMIGWDSNNDGLVEIHAKDSTVINFIDLPSIITEVNKKNNIGLRPVTFKPGTWRGDHDRFWQSNFNAVMLIQGLYSDDFDENYHTLNDKLEYFNLNFFHRVSKLAIASIATLSEIQDYINIIPPQFSIAQNYPNPFNSETRIDYTIPSDSYVSIKIYNSLGQLIETLVSKFHKAGNYNISYRAENMTSGVYFYTIQSNDFIDSKKMIYLK
jgi:hypothetical protein